MRDALKFYRILAIILLITIFLAVQASASPQGITVAVFSPQGDEMVSEQEIAFTEINSSLQTVGGPEGVLLSFQGPTFMQENLWDPDQTVNVDNLKTRVAGVSVKDLLEYADTPESIETITFVADDGYRKTLPAANIMDAPEEQGEGILAYWYADAGLLPDESGYRLYFMAPDGIYGNEDMHQTLPATYQHFFMNAGDKTAYPSAKGLSVAKITRIEVR